MDFHIVWTNVMSRDKPAQAFRASKEFSQFDERFRQYYDAERLAGLAVSKSLGWERDFAAWDIYLFYGPEAVWEGDTPPPPAEYMHQLARRRDGHFRPCGGELERALREAMGRVMGMAGGEKPQ